MREKIVETYKNYFSENPLITTAPGRINLIGEHTDYNLGFVLPGAIDRSIFFATGLNKSNKINLYSVNFNKKYSFHLDKVEVIIKHWANYFIGVIKEIQKIKPFKLQGFNCVFGGNLPTGAGLSSSAAIETGFAVTLNELFGIGLSKQEIIELSQRAEHFYVGTKCGIMDQFACMLGKEGHVFKLDCKSLEYKHYQVKMPDIQLVIVNSHVKHSNSNSEYNNRRRQCEQGVKATRKYFPEVKTLRDVSHNMLIACKRKMDPLIYKRCKYVLDENQRVHECCSFLKNSETEKIGNILFNGHKGLSEEYEVSCPEIDFLVDLAENFTHVYGARMMGGGFGGCTINLVGKNYVQDMIAFFSQAYQKKFGLTPGFYECSLENGVTIL